MKDFGAKSGNIFFISVIVRIAVAYVLGTRLSKYETAIFCEYFISGSIGSDYVFLC